MNNLKPTLFIRALIFVGLVSLAHAADNYTALDRYVAAPDASYRYTLFATVPSPGITVYEIDLLSQTWLTAAEVDQPQWHHWLTIYKPDTVVTSTALLVIDGGSNSATPPAPDLTYIFGAATAGAVIVDLGQVPNEPLTFAGQTQSVTEDALIAYTWAQFLTTGDDRWPARLPMTKAAARAMDAATDFLSKLPTGPFNIRNFIVTGASKRGWATWTTGAVDSRVIAIAPIVIDTLNVQECFVHTWQAYGFWPDAVVDYVNAGIFNWIGTTQMFNLMNIEDPYNYRSRLSLPKYMIYSTGDQFFLPDNAQFYFPELKGRKYLRYVPNTDHSMQSTDAVTGLLAWAQAVTSDWPMPRFFWSEDGNSGTLVVRALDAPAKVLLWKATNPSARDFRLETIGPAWTSTPVNGANGIYAATVPKPAAGFTAYFLELTFPGPGGNSLVFTTEVAVMPNTYPFAPPAGSENIMPPPGTDGRKTAQSIH